MLDGAKVAQMLGYSVDNPEPVDGGTRQEIIAPSPAASVQENSAFNEFGFVLFDDFEAQPKRPIHYLVDGLLRMESVSLLISRPKCGKSVLARCLCASIADGRPFLGKDVRQGKVMACFFEEIDAEVQKHFVSLGVTNKTNLAVYVAPAPDDAMGKLISAIKEFQPALVVVDTLARVVSLADFNDYRQTTAALEAFSSAAQEIGSHILLLHHERKMAATDAIDTVLGSTGLAGSVSTVLSLKSSPDGTRTISTSGQRYGTPLADTVLSLRSDGWVIVEGAKADVDAKAVGQEIIRYMQSQPHTSSLTAKEIVQALRKKEVRVKAGLHAALGEGHIVRDGSGRSGDPFLYRLKV